MTDREKIIELARTVWSAGDVYIGPSMGSLEAFWKAAQAEAFEQAAEIFQREDCLFEGRHIANAIRALKEK